MKKGYDAIVIGTGQAGLSLARRLSSLGMPVAAASVPSMPRLDCVLFLTNSLMMDLDTVPRHPLIGRTVGWKERCTGWNDR